MRKEKKRWGQEIRLNFKLILGRRVGTLVYGRRARIGRLKRAIDDRKKNQYQFAFENGYTLIINRPVFLFHTKLRSEDGWLYFEYNPDPVFSGIVSYFLFESYGLPLEFTVDEMAESNIPVDEMGFRILQEMGRKRDKDTFKDRNAFGEE